MKKKLLNISIPNILVTIHSVFVIYIIFSFSIIYKYLPENSIKKNILVVLTIIKILLNLVLIILYLIKISKSWYLSTIIFVYECIKKIVFFYTNIQYNIETGLNLFFNINLKFFLEIIILILIILLLYKNEIYYYFIEKKRSKLKITISLFVMALIFYIINYVIINN
jgi:hypothetical protein